MLNHYTMQVTKAVQVPWTSTFGYYSGDAQSEKEPPSQISVMESPP